MAIYFGKALLDLKIVTHHMRSLRARHLPLYWSQGEEFRCYQKHSAIVYI